MITSTGAAVSTSHLPALSDSSDGVTFTLLGASIRLIARATDTDGRFCVFEQTTPSGWGPPRHVHANEDEIIYVLDGTYEMSLGDERRTVSTAKTEANIGSTVPATPTSARQWDACSD